MKGKQPCVLTIDFIVELKRMNLPIHYGSLSSIEECIVSFRGMKMINNA